MKQDKYNKYNNLIKGYDVIANLLQSDIRELKLYVLIYDYE